VEPTTLTRAEAPVARYVYEFRDFVAAGYRWRKRVWVVVILVLVATGVFSLLSWSYASEMKIMVHRGRIDKPVAPDDSGATIQPELTAGEVASEVELLRSHDVLRDVVQRTGMEESTSEPLWYRMLGIGGASGEDLRRAKAIRSLNDKLEIVLPRESNIVTVSFEAATAQDAHAVLSELGEAYLEKHTALHRPSGQHDFFAEQADVFRKQLDEANAQLTEFSNSGGTILGESELQFAVDKLGELRHELSRTMTDIEEARLRISTLELQLAETPSRMQTAVRSADNPHLMMEFERTLLGLELRRTELLEKFEPTYRLVTEVDREIAQTRSAIEIAKASPIRDETTDRDPTFDWLRSELARGQTELSSLTARAASIRESVSSYQSRAQQLVGSSLEQQGLVRKIKHLEATYQLYVEKREEARVSNALDRNRILSVSIAQPPTMPALPVRSPTMTLAAGFLLALFMGLCTVLVSEFIHNALSDSIRTADEVRVHLDAPIVCALPPIEEPGKTLDLHS
jgi:uncharacterized protein involved in exopolysaccharide biosynthesis